MSFLGFSTNFDLFAALCSYEEGLPSDVYLFYTLKSRIVVKLCEAAETELKDWCYQFCNQIYDKWFQSGCEITFQQNNLEWFNSEIRWPDCFERCNIIHTTANPEYRIEETASTSKPDDSIATEDLSNHQKRKLIGELFASCSQNELLYSTERALQAAGKNNLAEIMTHLLKNPEKVSQVLNVIKKEQNPRKVSTQKAFDRSTLKKSKSRNIKIKLQFKSRTDKIYGLLNEYGSKKRM